MPQSLSYLLIHIVFSTKDRAPKLTPEVGPNLHAYLATVARNSDCECFRVGGIADHIHLAIRISRTTTIAQLVEGLRTSSSKWLKTQQIKDFSWQKGYGAFSVGPNDLDALVRYIDEQEEHHRTRTFQEEYRAFLKRYGVPSTNVTFGIEIDRAFSPYHPPLAINPGRSPGLVCRRAVGAQTSLGSFIFQFGVASAFPFVVPFGNLLLLLNRSKINPQCPNIPSPTRI